MSEAQQTTRTEKSAPQTQQPATSSGGSSDAMLQLKASLRGMSYDDQVAALSPVQADGGHAGGDVHAAAAHGISGGGGSMPHAGQIQQAFGGHDISGISAHVGGKAAEGAKAMGAEAYATGSDVAFAGAPSVHTAAHEAAHVIQQQAGVSLSGGVGKVGDSYEQHADQVADAVVAGKSAAPILDQMTGGGGGGGVQAKAVQMEASANDQSQAGGQQVDLTATDVSRESDGKTPTQGTAHESVQNPLSHPYFPTFKARVAALFASGKVGDPPQSVETIATQIWVKLCNAMVAARPGMDDPATYSNWERKYVDMTQPTFTKSMGEFRKVCGEIAKYSATQFAAGKSFGFWSKNQGKLLSESICDVTLETSGVGALFDKLPTLNGSTAGWDVDLWAGLSHAYATAVANAVAAEGKRIHVCMGDGVRPDNIWGLVESKAVEKNLSAVGLTMKDRVTYHGAAAKKKDRGELDTAARGGEFHGAVASGLDRDSAAAAADQHYATLTD